MLMIAGHGASERFRIFLFGVRVLLLWRILVDILVLELMNRRRLTQKCDVLELFMIFVTC